MKKAISFLFVFSLFLLSSNQLFSQITSFPHTTTFENASDMSTTASDVNSKWVTRTDGDWAASEILWTRASGSTPSMDTGPTSANGGTWYVYVESSGTNSGDDAELSANYDFSGRENASITFSFYNYADEDGNNDGSGVGPADMALYVYDVTNSKWSGALWDNIRLSADPKEGWLKETVSLSDYDGKSVQIWFTLNGYGWQSDGALDDIVVNSYSTTPTYYVDDSGSDSNNGSSGSPFATLGHAISTASDASNVTISVGAGTYTEEDLTISKSDIHIKGAGAGSTIFDGDLDGRFAIINDNNITISNMTIKEYGTSNSCTSNCGGGAILVNENKYGFIINDVIFDGNITDGTSGDGGAIEFLSGSSSSLNSTIFKNNKAGSTASYASGRNGGATKGNGTATVIFNNCVFYDNVARGYSGAHCNWMNAGGYAIFHNCTVEGNTQYDTNNYGAVSALYGNIFIRNSILTNTTDGSGANARDFVSVYGVNLIYSSQSGSALSGTNSTSSPSFTDAANNDYTLQSGSPAIDAGSSTYATTYDLNDFSKPQGQSDDIGAYEHRNTWDGSSSTAWATTANWSEGVVPVAGRSPVIANVANDPDITTNVTLEDITIQSGAILDINSTGSLTLTDDFTNSSGTVNLNSAADHFPAIKVAGDASGNITYYRYVNPAGNNEWDLIGSPVDGLSISNFATTNTTGTATLATGNGSGAGASGEYAIGVYDNSDDSWTNYTTGTIGAAGNFDIGKGYSMASVSGGTGLLAFTGTIPTTDQTQAIIDNSSSGRRWSLIANPFPSFVNANDDADGSNNFLTVNTSKLDDEYESVYGYDADGTGFTAYGQDYNSNTAIYIAPGQGFMVASDNTSSDTVSLTEAMQSVSGQDDFIDDVLEETNTLFLRLYHGDNNIEETKIKFQENMTAGLDPGYDLGNYYQGAAIMTRLLEQDQGTGFQDQQLPLSLMDDVVIPLVINQTAGQEFRVNLHTSSIGEVNIYLEDTELQTLTLLNEEDFVMTPTSDLSDAGRFYIHLTADTLSNEEVNTSLLNAYKKVDSNYITIEGLSTQSTSTEVSLFNILGTKVMDTTLDNTSNTQMISTNGLSTGIYVIKLESGQNQLTKKLIIR